MLLLRCARLGIVRPPRRGGLTLSSAVLSQELKLTGEPCPHGLRRCRTGQPRRRGPGTQVLERALGLLFILALPLIFPPAGSCAWALERPKVRLSTGARINLQTESVIPDEWTSRLELQWHHRPHWRLSPFLETRKEIDSDRWSRIELGGEIGWAFTSWAYLGSGLHRAWVSPDRDRFEWEIRPVFAFPLPFLKVRSEPIELYAMDEYTYDLSEGSGIRNEIAAGVQVPLPIPHLSLLAGWRHLDAIHSTDSDQLEGLLQVQF